MSDQYRMDGSRRLGSPAIVTDRICTIHGTSELSHSDLPKDKECWVARDIHSPRRCVFVDVVRVHDD